MCLNILRLNFSVQPLSPWELRKLSCTDIDTTLTTCWLLLPFMGPWRSQAYWSAFLGRRKSQVESWPCSVVMRVGVLQLSQQACPGRRASEILLNIQTTILPNRLMNTGRFQKFVGGEMPNWSLTYGMLKFNILKFNQTAFIEYLLFTRSCASFCGTEPNKMGF